MDSIPALTIQDVANIDQILQNYIEKSESDLIVVVDKGGNVLSQFGDMEVIDVTIIAALAAGSFAATKELARRIGEVEFNALYHQGNGSHIFMNSVDEDTIMIIVFGSDTTVGLVRHYATDTARELSLLLETLRVRGNPGGFSFDSADVAASSPRLFNE